MKTRRDFNSDYQAKNQKIDRRRRLSQPNYRRSSGKNFGERWNQIIAPDVAKYRDQMSIPGSRERRAVV